LKQNRTMHRRNFPPWLKRKILSGGHANRVRKLLEDLKLTTVCEQALCPNIGECFGAQTATFLIMGPVCTRNCRFCAIAGGKPAPPDPDEPRRVAEAARRLGLAHVVVTSVTRDDMPDGGGRHFIATIHEIRKVCDASVEILTPDFQGVERDILSVAECRPDIFNHNVETIERLYPAARPLANYRRSLGLLKTVKDNAPHTLTKSGLMVGLGETAQEVKGLLGDLRSAGCDIVTIGQYLQPGEDHLCVERYVHPDEFELYQAVAEDMGFLGVASGPYVRSSYNARRIFEAIRSRGPARN